MLRCPPPIVILAAALTAACRPASDAPRSAGGDARLEAPAPSSVTLAGLLGAASTGYDNAQQALYLQEESRLLGISSLGKPSGQTWESEEPAGVPVSYEEGLERTRAMTKQFAAQRRAIDKGRPKAVGLEGMTPRMIPGKPQGGPLKDELDSDGRPRL